MIHEKLQEIASTEIFDTVSDEAIHEWAVVLFHDALLTRIFTEEDRDDSERELLNEALEQTFEYSDLTLLQAKTSFLDRSYVRSLKELLADIYQGKISELDPPKSLDLVYRTIDLTQRRKRHSDNYQKGKMRLFLRDDSYSLSEKIAYLQPFLEQNDGSLLQYGANYFRRKEAKKAKLVVASDLDAKIKELGNFRKS